MWLSNSMFASPLDCSLQDFHRTRIFHSNDLSQIYETIDINLHRQIQIYKSSFFKELNILIFVDDSIYGNHKQLKLYLSEWWANHRAMLNARDWIWKKGSLSLMNLSSINTPFTDSVKPRLTKHLCGTSRLSSWFKSKQLQAETVPGRAF